MDHGWIGDRSWVDQQLVGAGKDGDSLVSVVSVGEGEGNWVGTWVVGDNQQQHNQQQQQQQ